MKINKSFSTNLVAVVFIAFSFVVTNEFSELFLFIGLFALSGALTNLLAIHMLFEKVPLLYGSGVIPARFESFKIAIKEMMMEQFFTREKLKKFLSKEEQKINLAPIIEQTDFSPAFEALSKTVMESSFGGMLGMFGGVSVLENLKDPFIKKMKSATIKIVNSDAFNQTLQSHLNNSSISDDMMSSIEQMIDTRLEELTPKMVKELVQKLIKEHLGWLVVWGGVVGGFIGAISSFFV